MRRNRALGMGLILAGMAVVGCATGEKSARLVYPPAAKVDQVDDYHGVKVADPYRWLEDANSGETKAWIEAENKVTFAYLAKIPQREAIRKRLTELANYERFSAPFKEGGKYFYSRNSGLQNQSVLYVADSAESEGRVLLDPNALSKDGTVALAGMAVSDDGKHMAYGISVAGSDWVEWRVRDVETGKDLADHLKWTKRSGASWTKDGRGFFYTRLPEPPAGSELQAANYYEELRYHKLGTPQAEDVLIYKKPEHKEWRFAGNVTDDGRYLVISVFRGTERKNRVYCCELSEGKVGSVVELLNQEDANYSFIDNDGPVFWFLTDKDAERSRVIAVDTRRPEKENWRELIGEAKETLQSVSVVGERFIAQYLKDAHTVVRVHALDGKLEREVELPGIGSASGFGGKRKDKETFYTFTSFTAPATVYRYDVASGRSTVYRRPKVAFEPEQFETKQVFYNSKDGTRVPMFIVHKKGLVLDGRNPTVLYGYGGFRISLTPSFSTANVAWMEMGGVYAVPNLRGGGEYGKEWHDAGKKLKRQNVFDDFIAAAEWLIANKYTSPAKLAISGGSNGGLLVGACMTQRPELFGAALPAVGVMDMLRFHKFTVGWGWVSDYGSADNPEEFRALYAYSPLHNLKAGVKYPATLVTTSDHDDRVVPAHSFKFAAALQAAQAGDKPVLIRIETKAGHGAGKPITKVIEEQADKWAFLVANLGMKVD